MSGYLSELQKKIKETKEKHGFKTDSVEVDLAYLVEEMGETAAAWRRGQVQEFLEELVDVMIVALGLFEMKGISSWQAVVDKIRLNEKREYKKSGLYSLPLKKKSRFIDTRRVEGEEQLVVQLQQRIWKNKKKKGHTTDLVEHDLICLMEEAGEMVKGNRRDDLGEFLDGLTDLVVYGLGLFEMFSKDAYQMISKKLKVIAKRKYQKRGDYSIKVNRT